MRDPREGFQCQQMFAVGTALLAGSVKQLSCLVRLFRRISEVSKLTVNVEKSMFLMMRKEGLLLRWKSI